MMQSWFLIENWRVKEWAHQISQWSGIGLTSKQPLKVDCAVQNFAPKFVNSHCSLTRSIMFFLLRVGCLQQIRKPLGLWSNQQIWAARLWSCRRSRRWITASINDEDNDDSILVRMEIPKVIRRGQARSSREEWGYNNRCRTRHAYALVKNYESEQKHQFWWGCCWSYHETSFSLLREMIELGWDFCHISPPIPTAMKGSDGNQSPH